MVLDFDKAGGVKFVLESFWLRVNSRPSSTVSNMVRVLFSDGEDIVTVTGSGTFRRECVLYLEGRRDFL